MIGLAIVAQAAEAQNGFVKAANARMAEAC